MATAWVSDKGQITIPAKARKKLGISGKSRVEVEVRDKEVVIRPMRSILDVAGIFHEAAKGKSTDWQVIREEAMQAVAEEVMNEDRC